MAPHISTRLPYAALPRQRVILHHITVDFRNSNSNSNDNSNSNSTSNSNTGVG